MTEILTNIHDLMKPTDSLPPCDDDIHKNGKSVAALSGGSAQLIQRFVRELAEYSGESVDWHYAGGRAVVRTTGDVGKVQDALRDLRIVVQLA